MSTFVQAGRYWINLELVTSIEFVESPKTPGEVVAMRVHYSTGKHDDFTDATEVQHLRQFLESHRAK
jgi:hypothetical protein